MSRLSTSERQQGKPAVPVPLQRQRILKALASRMGERGLNMSSMAYCAFPDFRFRSPQGAALCISRTVRQMHQDGVIYPQEFGYNITAAGRKELGDE